jgi:hypothetical protein
MLVFLKNFKRRAKSYSQWQQAFLLTDHLNGEKLIQQQATLK